MIGAVILQVVLIILNAIFASAEVAIISLSEAKLEKLSEGGGKRAGMILKMKEDSSKFLSMIQVAVTLFGFLGAAYAADHFAKPLESWLIRVGAFAPSKILHSACVLGITLVLSYFCILLGEWLPRRIAVKHSESVAMAWVTFLTFATWIFAPFVWFLTKSTNAMLFLFRIDPKETEETVTEEDIRLMIDSGSEQGSIDSMEQEMIRNIFEFDDISLGEVCTHRRDVTFLYKKDSIEEWKTLINTTRYRYYPICGDGVDDIVAVLNASKFFHESLNHASRAVLEASEKPYFVPETMKADVLFTNMKKTRNHFAIVVDEYGGTRGVITMHDLLELLVGDLGEKGYDYVEEIKKLDDGRFEIRGSAPLRDVEEELDLAFDEEDYDTFGGYIFSLLDVIPEDGTQIELETDDIVIHVESIEDHRIERTIVTKKEKTEDE